MRSHGLLIVNDRLKCRTGCNGDLRERLRQAFDSTLRVRGAAAPRVWTESARICVCGAGDRQGKSGRDRIVDTNENLLRSHPTDHTIHCRARRPRVRSLLSHRAAARRAVPSTSTKASQPLQLHVHGIANTLKHTNARTQRKKKKGKCGALPAPPRRGALHVRTAFGIPATDARQDHLCSIMMLLSGGRPTHALRKFSIIALCLESALMSGWSPRTSGALAM